MPIPSNLTNAIEARKKSKIKNDKIVLNAISQYSGLTVQRLAEWISNLADKPDLKRSFLINSLQRLEDEGKIKSNTELVHGKLIKKYYKKYSDKITVIIPSAARLKYIQDEPHAYAIDANTIIVSIKNNKELIEECKFNSKLKKLKQNEFELSKEFIDFYNLKPGKFSFDVEYDDNKIEIKIIRNVSSNDKPKSKPSKNILVLEDHIDWGKMIKRRAENEGHKVTVTSTVDEFNKILKKKGKSFDIISLDNQIDGKNVAQDVSIEIKYYAPDTHVGLISSRFDEPERSRFQDLAFEFILKKSGRKLNWEEFFAWVSTV